MMNMTSLTGRQNEKNALAVFLHSGDPGLTVVDRRTALRAL